jgi:hypothetical protein
MQGIHVKERFGRRGLLLCWADHADAIMTTRCRYLLWVIGLVGLFGLSLSAATTLTQKQAEELVLNTPDAVASRARGGCPKASVNWVSDKQSTIFFSVHDPCNKSGAASNKIGQYTVDLKNGEVWRDVDRREDGRNLIDSARMKELRLKFLGFKK